MRTHSYLCVQDEQYVPPAMKTHCTGKVWYYLKNLSPGPSECVDSRSVFLYQDTQKGYRTKFISGSQANDENRLQQMASPWSKTLETILYWNVVCWIAWSYLGNFIPAIVEAGAYVYGTGQACIFYVQGIRTSLFHLVIHYHAITMHNNDYSVNYLN